MLTNGADEFRSQLGKARGSISRAHVARRPTERGTVGAEPLGRGLSATAHTGWMRLATASLRRRRRRGRRVIARAGRRRPADRRGRPRRSSARARRPRPRAASGPVSRLLAPRAPGLVAVAARRTRRRSRALLDVQMYDVDAFDTPRSLVRAMHARGIHVVCYISAGTWENWRPDAKRFPAVGEGQAGRRVAGGEVARHPAPRPARPDHAGADGPLRAQGVRRRRVRQRRRVHERRNRVRPDRRRPAPVQRVPREPGAPPRAVRVPEERPRSDPTLLPYFDAALNEQCFQYDECGKLRRFVEAGKPVFGVEYSLPIASFCPTANARNFNFLKKHLALGPWRRACR